MLEENVHSEVSRIHEVEEFKILQLSQSQPILIILVSFDSWESNGIYIGR